MVLTTPDANRTMLSYLGTSAEIALDSRLTAAIASARLLVIEGYLWEMPGASSTLPRAMQLARAAGCKIALTAGDVGLVARHRAELWDALSSGVDFLFTNRSV